MPQSKKPDCKSLLGTLCVDETSEPIEYKCPICNDSGIVRVKCSDGITRKFTCSCCNNAVDYRKFSRLPHYEKRELLPIAQDFIDNFRAGSGQWFSLFGKSGCGKTTQACMVVDALTTRSKNPVRCRFYKTSELISELIEIRYDYEASKKAFDKLNGYELIVLDDLFDCACKNQYEEYLVRLIKDRYASKKSLILTCEGNLFKAVNIFPEFGEALIGRIIERSGKYLYIDKSGVNHRLDSLQSMTN